MDKILIDLIPTMSSNTCDVGTVSASGYYNTNYPYNAFDKTCVEYPTQSPPTANHWYYYLPTGVSTAYIQFQFNKPVKVYKIEIFYGVHTTVLTTEERELLKYNCELEYGNGDLIKVESFSDISCASLRDSSGNIIWSTSSQYKAFIINAIVDRIKHTYTNNPDGTAFPPIYEMYVYGRNV